MRRFLGLTSVVALLGIAISACSSVVPLTERYYPPVLDTGEVYVLDARELNRAQLTRVLDENTLVGRFDIRIPSGPTYESDLAQKIEESKPKVLQAGGNMLMYTDNSEMVGVIKQDARFAGAQDAVTIYVLLRGDGD